MYDEQRYKEIQHVWVHPHYEKKTYKNDIAVVELESRLDWHVTVSRKFLYEIFNTRNYQ